MAAVVLGSLEPENEQAGRHCAAAVGDIRRMELVVAGTDRSGRTVVLRTAGMDPWLREKILVWYMEELQEKSGTHIRRVHVSVEDGRGDHTTSGVVMLWLVDLLDLWLLALLLLLLVLVTVEETVKLLSNLREERHDCCIGLPCMDDEVVMFKRESFGLEL